MLIEKITQIIKEGRSVDDLESIEYVGLMKELHAHHMGNCKEYANICNSLHESTEMKEIEDIPYIHVSCFKEKKMLSVEESKIVKVMYSSGTSGKRSMIMLDKETANNQRYVLNQIFGEYMSIKRPIMLALERDKDIRDRGLFNARKAAVIGFGQMCKKVLGILDENSQIDENIVREVIQNYEEHDILIFGFTSIFWECSKSSEITDNLKKHLRRKGKILHGGGWKKIEAQKVDKKTFNKKMEQTFGIMDIRNYYGMIEQTGSIFLECEKGKLHENRYARLISRESETLGISNEGSKGIAQVLSILPYSYSGISLLTDDIVKVSYKECECGRKGKTFEILGRVKEAEIRGCSDAYQR